MKKIILYLLIVSVIGACKPATRPPNLLGHDPFVEVLVDVRLLEGAYASRVSRPDTVGARMEGYYESLFAKHNITREQFFSSYNYYLQHHEEMIAIENEVIERLSALQVTQTEVAKPYITADSLHSDSLRRARTLERQSREQP